MMAHSLGLIDPKKQCGWVVHCSGPPVENRSTQSSRRCCSASKFLSSCMIRLFSDGMFRPIGFSPSTDFFAIFPKIRPTKLRGRDFNPAAISIHAEQCASICATFILPHCFSLSGLKNSIRFLISIAQERSNRLFIVPHGVIRVLDSLVPVVLRKTRPSSTIGRKPTVSNSRSPS
jgi:hypothetical protein